MIFARRRGGSPWAVVAVIAVVAAGIAGCWFVGVPRYREARRVPAPKAYKPFKAADGSFQCQYPEGWSRAAGEAHAIISAAVFKKGSASIEVTADLLGSLVGDFTPKGAQGEIDPGTEQLLQAMPEMQAAMKEMKKPAAERLHEAGAKAAAKRFSGYQEGEMKTMVGQAGDGRYSEFTADGGWLDGKLRGYRVTIMGPQRALTVICRCPESEWKTLKPAFERVVNSLQPGT
ncbi:MAG: hypothetical protein ACK47B_05165 [Armatimonadota bacterium]